MKSHSPLKVVELLVGAINSRDVEAATKLYQPDAVFYVGPNQMVGGKENIRSALAEMVSVSPNISTKNCSVIEKGNVALYMSKWEMCFTDNEGHLVKEAGFSADVLERGEGGEWFIAIDNPWGSKIINAAG